MWFSGRSKAKLAGDFSGLIARAPHVVSTEASGETVLLDVRRGQYHTLNEVGSRVWDLLRVGTTVGEIVRAIREEYEIPADWPADRVEQDVRALLTQLHSVGLLLANGAAATEASP
jgi:Coenzyme PQQ synthesis protein D (PqqD)